MKGFIISAIFILASFHIFSEPQPKFKHFTIEDGLSNNSVRRIIQDKKGFLWFGTLNGLNRYDGKNIKVYKYEPGNLNSISDDRIIMLMEDTYEYMWIVTFNNEIYRFNPRTEKFLNISNIIAEYKTIVRVDIYPESSPGIIWLWLSYGEEGGLVRFMEFSDLEEYKIDIIDTTNILPGNTIGFVHKDKTGRLWIGTDKGLVSIESDTFDIASPVYKTYFKGNRDYNFNYVCEAIDKIWFGSKKSGLLTYSFTDKTVKKWKGVQNLSAEVRGLDLGNMDDILVTTHGQGVIYIIENGEKFYHFNNEQKRIPGLVENSYFDIFVDKEGKFWITSLRRGITLFDPENLKFTFYDLNSKSRESLGDPDKHIFYEDNMGDFWLGLYGGGICHYNRDRKDFDQYFHNPSDPYSLTSNLILSLFIDHSRNLWIGTFQGGLNKLELTQYDFRFVQPVQNASFKIKNEVRSIIEDRFGRLWVGTKEGHIYCYNRQKNVCFKIPEDLKNQDSYVKSSVHAMLEDRDGNLWIGTKGEGLYKINGLLAAKELKNKSFKIDHYIFIEDLKPLNPFNLSHNAVFALFQDTAGQIWVGTYNGGINLIENPAGSINFKYYRNNPGDTNTICDDRIRCFLKDSDENLWIGTSNGLSLLKAEYLKSPEKRFINLMKEPADKSSLSNSDILYLHKDQHGNIWVATYGGGLNLLHQNIEDGKYWFEHYFRKNGLPSDVIFSILEDRYGSLWLGTDNGLCKFSLSQQKIQKFSTEEGLGDNFFSEGVCLVTTAGEFIFGQKGGFVSFFPDSIKKEYRKYPVVLTEFSIFSDNKIYGTDNIPLLTLIEKNKEIKLKHNQNFIKIEYAILDYTYPEKCQYAYYLEGLENKWNFVGNKREATYTNLNPGDYIFHVKGSDKDGIWNEEGTFVKITILPPWWNTLWFKISLLVFILAAAIGFYYYRVNMLKRQQIYLQKLVKERTREIEEKNIILTEQANELNETNALLEERQQKVVEQAGELIAQKEKLERANVHLSELNSTKDKFFSIIAHDLKNPLNTILGFAELLKIKYDKLTDEKKYKYSEIIYSSSKNIYSLLENLLQWARTQTDKITFEPSSFNIKDLLEKNITLLKVYIKNKNISIEYNDSEDFDVYADRNMINTVIRNLLSNAIKFSNVGGEIFIDCVKKNGNIEVSIKDTGVGMSDDEIKKLFRVDANFSKNGTNGETGTGLGLILCKEFIDKNGGVIWAESNPGKGSRFSFTVPSQK